MNRNYLHPRSCLSIHRQEFRWKKNRSHDINWIYEYSQIFPINFTFFAGDTRMGMLWNTKFFDGELSLKMLQFVTKDISECNNNSNNLWPTLWYCNVITRKLLTKHFSLIISEMELKPDYSSNAHNYRWVNDELFKYCEINWYSFAISPLVQTRPSFLSVPASTCSRLNLSVTKVQKFTISYCRNYLFISRIRSQYRTDALYARLGFPAHIPCVTRRD